MKMVLAAIVVLSATQSFAASKCATGTIGNQTYEVINEGMNEYGDFKSSIILSNDGKLTGKGNYYATQEEAYLEAKYANRKSGLKAVVSTSYQQDGAFFTLCVGTNLKDASKYTCTSCVAQDE